MKDCGPAIERSTCVSAAKLTIASAPSASAAATACGSSIPPCTKRTAPATSRRFSRRPAQVSLSSTVTLSPCSRTRPRTKAEPMKPAPPQTSSLIGPPRGQAASAAPATSSGHRHRRQVAIETSAPVRQARWLRPLAAQHGEGRPSRRPRELTARARLGGTAQARARDDLARELKPRAAAGGGDVHDPHQPPLEPQPEQGLGQVRGGGRTADLIIHHPQLLTLARQAQDRLRKAPPADAEQP